MAQWYVIEQPGHQVGPLNSAQVQQMIQSGRLQARHMAWTEAFGTTWRTLGETEFSHLFRATAPSPPLPPAGFGSTHRPFQTGAPAFYASTASIDEKTLIFIVYALYLAGIFSFAFTTIIGLVIAYVKRPTSNAIAQSHLTFLIWTFWLNLGFWAIMFVIGIATFAIIAMVLPVLSLVLLPLFYIVPVVAFLWYLIRLIKGIIALNDNRAIHDPHSWWFG
ncbi:MAG: GYF domain-containing protein [Alphaproteobacteria bacterium]|jgi:uncharacterized membrane protein|nr:GYF domain-containing protein [Alphaproteobacteria bacterium]